MRKGFGAWCAVMLRLTGSVPGRGTTFGVRYFVAQKATKLQERARRSRYCALAHWLSGYCQSSRSRFDSGRKHHRKMPRRAPASVENGLSPRFARRTWRFGGRKPKNFSDFVARSGTPRLEPARFTVDRSPIKPMVQVNSHTLYKAVMIADPVAAASGTGWTHRQPPLARGWVHRQKGDHKRRSLNRFSIYLFRRSSNRPRRETLNLVIQVQVLGAGPVSINRSTAVSPLWAENRQRESRIFAMLPGKQ